MFHLLSLYCQNAINDQDIMEPEPKSHPKNPGGNQPKLQIGTDTKREHMVIPVPNDGHFVIYIYIYAPGLLFLVIITS